jgi:hypothetical protein
MLGKISSGRWLAVSALLIVACGSDLNEETTSEPDDAIPSGGNSASPTSSASKGTAQGGTGAAATGNDDEPGGGIGGAPSESDDGGPGANDRASSKDPAKTGDVGAGGRPSDAEEPTVLALEDCNLAAPFDLPVPAFTGTTIAEGVTFSQDGFTAYVSSKATSTTSYDIYVTTRTPTTAFGPLTSLGTSFNNPWDERSPFLSADGLKLYLTKLIPWSWDVTVSTWTNGAFPTPQAIGAPISSTSLNEQDPFFRAGTNELYFAAEAPPNDKCKQPKRGGLPTDRFARRPHPLLRVDAPRHRWRHRR